MKSGIILQEDMDMRDWMDFNGDGEVDSTELFLAEEMLCGNREEYEALFGDVGDFGEVIDEEQELEDELMYVGLDKDELELMDPDERRESLEDVGLDADDFDFD